MGEGLRLVSILAIGFGLGLAFFGGLWWTVQKGLAAPRSALRFVVSFVLRTSLVLFGLYWAGGSDGKRLLFCLSGFVAARLFVVRITQNMSSLKINWKEIGDAPHSR